MYLKSNHGNGAIVESYFMGSFIDENGIHRYWFVFRSSNKTGPKGDFIDKMGNGLGNGNILYKISGGDKNQNNNIDYTITPISLTKNFVPWGLPFTSKITKGIINIMKQSYTFPRSNATNGYIKDATVTATDLSSGEVLATTTTNREGEYAFPQLTGLPEYVLIRLSGGTDISTNKPYEVPFRAIAKTYDGGKSIENTHLTWLSTLVAMQLEKLDSLTDTIILDMKTKIARTLGLETYHMDQDHISAEHHNAVELNQAFMLLTDALLYARPTLTPDKIVQSISDVVASSPDTMNFATLYDIQTIIEHVSIANSLSITSVENANMSQYVTQLIQRIVDENAGENAGDNSFEAFMTFAKQITIASRDYLQQNTVQFDNPDLDVSALTSAVITKSATVPIYIINPNKQIVKSFICFPAKTPVNTDQGVVHINKLKSSIHTIRGKRIAAITQTVTSEKSLVCFEANSLGKNVPNKKTTMSLNHKVKHNGEMCKAKNFVDDYEGVTLVKYTGETLYNVLLEEHGNMKINNLVCETLDANSLAAKMCMQLHNNEPLTKTTGSSRKRIQFTPH